MSGRQKRLLAGAVGGVILALFAGVAVAALKEGPDNPLTKDDKVILCHATGSQGNPYTSPGAGGGGVAVNQVFAAGGHYSHPNDIIPPFWYINASGHRVHFLGLNWTPENEAIYRNGCRRLGSVAVPIQPTLKCVDVSGGSFTAWFGYSSENSPAVTLSAGGGFNDITPGGNRGQPSTFLPGSPEAVVSVTEPVGTTITWTIRYGGQELSASATASSPPCTPPATPRIGIFVNCVSLQGTTYSAVFGYESEDTQPRNVDVGAYNRFFPAPEGRGQPIVFQPGNHPAVFTVSGIPLATALTWSLTTDQTRYARATALFPNRCPRPGPELELVPIGIFVTCVTNHARTYDAVFGYENDNFAQQVIPLGVRNTFVPAPGNRGQPTTFEPGTVRNAVTVRGIPNAVSLVWSVFHVGPRAAVANPRFPRKCDQEPLPPPPPPPEPQVPAEPPTPEPPPPPPRPPEHGLFATCVLTVGAPRTFTAIFGYANGSQDDVIVPIGSRNHVAPAPNDRGQPTVFRPGVNNYAFSVANVPRTQDVTWTVHLPNGDVRTATATARYPRDCITAPPPATADLVLTKTVSPSRATAGQRVTFTIHVINRGPNIALQVRVTDVVDSRLELLSASSTRGTCSTAGQRVTCRVAEFPPGAGMTITVAVRARGAGTIRNAAVATHSRRDPTPGNNRRSAVVHVTGVSGAVGPSFTG